MRAVENANGLGRLLSRQLLAAGETVVDVPAKLSARVRALSGAGHKTDGHDARSTADITGRTGTGVMNRLGWVEALPTRAAAGSRLDRPFGDHRPDLLRRNSLQIRRAEYVMSPNSVSGRGPRPSQRAGG